MIRGWPRSEDLAVGTLDQRPTLFLWQTSDATSGNYNCNGEPWPQVGMATRDVQAVREMAIAQGLRITMGPEEGFGIVLKFFDPFGNMLVPHQDREPA